MHGGRRAGSAGFALGGPLREEPCSSRREANPSEGWIHRSTALGVCMVQASSVMGTGSLWNFGWGWEREMVLASAFVPLPSRALYSQAQQLSLPVSSCLPALQAELLTYNIPDIKSHWLSEHTPSGPSAFASQTRRLCLARQAAPPPPRLPPASLCSTHCLSALPTLFHGPLVYTWLQRVHSSLLAVFWII